MPRVSTACLVIGTHGRVRLSNKSKHRPRRTYPARKPGVRELSFVLSDQGTVTESRFRFWCKGRGDRSLHYHSHSWRIVEDDIQLGILSEPFGRADPEIRYHSTTDFMKDDAFYRSLASTIPRPNALSKTQLPSQDGQRFALRFPILETVSKERRRAA